MQVQHLHTRYDFVDKKKSVEWKISECIIIIINNREKKTNIKEMKHNKIKEWNNS